MAEGNESRPLPIRKWYSVFTATYLTTTEAVYNTYNGRKFSDYDVLIFAIGGTGDDIRNTVIIPSSVWAANRKIFFTVVHGSEGENRTSVNLYYNSDTSIQAQVGISGAVNVLQVLGGRIE